MSRSYAISHSVKLQVVAQKLRNDRQALSEFFNEYETQLIQAGLRTSQLIEAQVSKAC